MQRLIELYRQNFGHTPQNTESLPKAGSNRHYVRLTGNDGESVIGVISPDTEENRCFIYLSRHFAGKYLPVPEVIAVSDDTTCYLQTDLGRTSLYQALERGRKAGDGYNEEEHRKIRQTIRLLPHIQVIGAEGLDEERLLSPRHFDERSAMFDLYYFKYCFLRTKNIACDEVRLENDLIHMASDLTVPSCTEKKTFLFRDFQARNVMMSPTPHFIDFQG